MKNIMVTDKVYNKLKALSDEQDEMIEVTACLYLERGMDELNRINQKAASLMASIEIHEAALESKQTLRIQ